MEEGGKGEMRREAERTKPGPTWVSEWQVSLIDDLQLNWSGGSTLLP